VAADTPVESPPSQGHTELPAGWQPSPLDEQEVPGQEEFLLAPDDEGLDLRVPRLGGPRMCGPRKGGRRLAKPQVQPVAKESSSLSPEQRLLILDTWRRSGLPAADFAEMVGLSKHTLYGWKKKFEEQGPAGLMDQPKGTKGSRMPDLTRRSILMLKEDHPDWGYQRISDVLLRGPGLSASPNAVANVLREEGIDPQEPHTRPHPDHVRRFERATPNQLWQTDLFTFMLKRQNRRVYLVAFMDDHSRYIVSYGLHASQSAALVLEVFRAGITSCGTPQEVLTDNGAQYVTWRGTSAFAKELQKRGIRHVVASPRRPQTLGKVERFWGTLWRECLESALFIDLADAQARIGHFIDYYNFRRPHQGLEGMVPADRFFQLAPQVKETLLARVASNALELARNGLPKAPFYLTGQAGGSTFSVHAEGERVILSRDGQHRQEIDLTPPAAPPQTMPRPVCPQGIVDPNAVPDQELPPGVSTLDEDMPKIQQSLAPQADTGGQP
jgi:transposase InsO family protein